MSKLARKTDTEKAKIAPTEEATDYYSRNYNNKREEIWGPELAPCGHRGWQECDGGGDYNVRKGVPDIHKYHVRGVCIMVISPRACRTWKDEPGLLVAEK